VFFREFVHLGSHVGQTRFELFQISQELLLNHESLEAALCSFIGRVFASGDGAFAPREVLLAFGEFRFSRGKLLPGLVDFFCQARLAFRTREQIALCLSLPGDELSAYDPESSAEGNYKNHQKRNNSGM